MALLALDLFARIIAVRIDAGPPFSALFTLWLDDRGGGAGFPFRLLAAGDIERIMNAAPPVSPSSPYLHCRGAAQSRTVAQPVGPKCEKAKGPADAAKGPRLAHQAARRENDRSG